MSPTIFGVIGPGFLNQVPTLNIVAGPGAFGDSKGSPNLEICWLCLG